MNIVRLLPAIEPHETRIVALSALTFVCVASGSLIARAAGDALFLSHFGSGPLPLMYVAGAIASGITTYACIRASRRLATGHIAIVTGSVLLLANLILFATFRSLPSFSRAGAYLLADVTVRIPVFLFWAFASEILDAPQSRRLFGVIGSAGTAACLPAGLIIGPFARRAGAESLVLLSAALMVGFVAGTSALMREQRGRGSKSAALVTGGRASAQRVLATPQLATIAALAVITSVVETVVDFQFKTTAAATGSSTALANIFGTIYALASVASLFIQLLIVHRFLAVAGALASLCVLPAALLLGETGIFRFRSAGWVFVTKALDITLTTTVNGTTRQLLYRGIRRESRLTARALADGLFLPLAIGTAGAGLALFSGSISLTGAAIAAAAGCLVWFIAARIAHSAYVAGLIESLKARQFGSSNEELFLRGGALRTWLSDAFGSASDDDLIYLASVLPQLGRLVRPEQLEAALARDNPKVKVAILQSLTAAGVKNGPAIARSLLHHPDAEVRRAAIFASGDPSAVADAFTDADAQVRAAAAAVFANAKDPKSRSFGREQLSAFAADEDPAFRSAAAEAFEHGAGTEFEFRTRILDQLLADSDVSVVLAALETIRTRRDSSLVNAVLPLLGRPVVAGAASDALAAMGPGVIDAVLPLLEPPRTPRHDAIIANIPPVLERIGDPRGLAVIDKLLTVAPEERTAVFKAFVRLLGDERVADARHEMIDALVAVECAAAKTRLSTVQRLGDGEGVRAARDAVSDLAACHVRNAFILLSSPVPDLDMLVLDQQITSGTAEKRSNAIELLENVLPKDLRELVLAVFEITAENGGAKPEQEVPNLLSDRDSEWVVAGAAWAAAELSLVSCSEQLESLKHHESAVVRETAVYALERLGVLR